MPNYGSNPARTAAETNDVMGRAEIFALPVCIPASRD
jgi:hypothetical protein